LVPPRWGSFVFIAYPPFRLRCSPSGWATCGRASGAQIIVENSIAIETKHFPTTRDEANLRAEPHASEAENRSDKDLFKRVGAPRKKLRGRFTRPL
jgi:hypothetical protein